MRLFTSIYVNKKKKNISNLKNLWGDFNLSTLTAGGSVVRAFAP